MPLGRENEEEQHAQEAAQRRIDHRDPQAVRCWGKTAPILPLQRGNVRLANLTVLNALLYVAEHDCKWRGLASSRINLDNDGG